MTDTNADGLRHLGRQHDPIVALPRRDGDHAAEEVHAYLREMILRGALPAESELNQVELADQLGVSRTPVREAIRRLQEEGLVEAEPQRRARVVGFDPGHLESIFTQRITLEALAASVSAPQSTEQSMQLLDELLARLSIPAEERDSSEWRQAHMEFHLELVRDANPHLIRTIKQNMERGEHYRLSYQQTFEATGVWVWQISNAEHRSIVEAFRRRDGHAAAAELAAHLARTAFSLLAQHSPMHDPKVLRAAVHAMQGEPF